MSATSQKWLLRAAPWFLPVGIVALWQLASSTGWLSSRILPSPEGVVEAFWSLSVSGELWQHLADTVCRGDDVRPRLALHIHHYSLLLICPCTQPAVFCSLFDGSDIAQANRCTVFIGNNELTIFICGLHLVVS